MDCRDFREAYSDFADGLLDEGAEVRARLHLAECCVCRRFDAAFRAGIGALRELPAPPFSQGFSARLQWRLLTEARERGPSLGQWSGAAGALLVVVTLAVAGLEVGRRVERRPRRTAASPPAPETSLARAPGGLSAARFALETVETAATFDLFDAGLAAAPFATGGQPRFDVPAVWVSR